MPKLTNKPRWTLLESGCFRDNILYSRLDGSTFYREWTPILNDGEGVPHEDDRAARVASECTLLGGGWALPADPYVLSSLINYGKELPAMDEEIAGGIEEGWFWTAQIDPSDSSYAFCVYFGDSYVGISGRDSSGLVRACREVPALAASGEGL